MKTCKVANIEIGLGMPKICIPIVESSKKEIINSAKNIKKHSPDLVEWRADFYDEIFDKKNSLEMAKLLKEELGEIGLIFTLRSKDQGGNIEITSEKYFDLIESISKSACIDIIDIELGQIKSKYIKNIEEIKKESKLLLSYHNFNKTEKREELDNIVEEMKSYEPDIYKLALMAKSNKDCLSCLELSLDLEERLEKPVVVISMGEKGIASRICCEIFSSAITFASLKKSSAPGQIEIEKLRLLLEVIHENLKNT